jgi:probable selenium-dependent hydroxylase accessory protein YqeC
MPYQFLQPWHDFLPREGGHVVSLLGGGGKTSLLAVLSELYRREKVPVAITTTTRTEPLHWEGLVVQEWQEVATDPAGSTAPVMFVRQGEHDDGKWRGLTVEQADRLGDLLPDRVLLVEADGSAGLPVKLHRPDEPLLPSRTSLAVAVVGMRAIARPLPEVMHRLGELTTPWSAAAAEPELFGWDHLYQLLTAPGGYLARLPGDMPAIVALTQLADLRDGIGLFGFLDRVMEQAGMPLVMLAELADDPPRIRTAYRVEPATGTEEQAPAGGRSHSTGGEPGDSGTVAGEGADAG